MVYPAIAVANAFVEKAKNGEIHNLTPMKLQKLMFFTQSWYLKKYSKPLFDGYFERWKYGPVLPEIYHEFKSFCSKDIETFGKDMWDEYPKINSDDEETIRFLNQIITIYGKFSGTELSWMTHQSGTAWSNGQMGSLIRLQEMISGKV